MPFDVSGTLNVLEGARKANVRKFIYADTSLNTKASTISHA